MFWRFGERIVVVHTLVEPQGLQLQLWLLVVGF